MMEHFISTNPRELMSEHLKTLRKYAKRAVHQGDVLTFSEEEDRADQMRDFWAIGTSFGLAEKELVALLYHGLIPTKRGCDCWTCKTRRTT